jgi:PAS domain S-box-containing protein
MTIRKPSRTRQGQADAERSIRELQDRGGAFVEAVEATRMPMLVTDPQVADNPIIYANAAFLDMCGYERDEVLGQNYFFLASPDSPPEAKERLLAAMAARENFFERVPLQTKDGREIWVAAFIVPMVENDRIVRHFASFLDVTEAVHGERQLREANELLDRRIGVSTRRLHEANSRLEAEVVRRRRIEATLRDALAELEQDLRFRDFLLREVNHRTKNALQTAIALLAMKARRADNEETRSTLERAMARLGRIADVYGLLTYRTDTPDRIDFADYLHRICASMVESMGLHGRVHVDVEVETDALWGADRVVPLGLIVGEVLTNALKHAFPEERRGRVLVHLRPAGDNSMELLIEDDGIGLPAQRRSGSLGLRLIEVFAQQIKGQLRRGPRRPSGSRVH